MSVTSPTNKVTFTGDGSTKTFPFSFSVYLTTDLVVQTVVITTGVTTTLAINTDYTVSLTGTAPSAGNVITTVAYASTLKLVITRTLPLTQLIVYKDNEQTPAATLQEMGDRDTMVDQQLQEQLNRAIVRDPTQTTQLTLPAPVTGDTLVWNASGQLINSNLTGPQGPAGPAGPAGSGSGDVLGPATNTDLKVPQWNGANTKTLKDGLAVGTAASNLVQLDGSAKLPAVDGSALTGLAGGAIATGTVATARLDTGTGANQIVKLDGSSKLPAVDGSALTNLPTGGGWTNMQTFTSNGTWTKPANTSKVFVRVWGGGGGGGEGGTAAAAGTDASSGSSSSFPGSATVTGAGGTFGSGGTSGAAATGVAGGVGGAGSNGTVNLTGGTGSTSGDVGDSRGANGGNGALGGSGGVGQRFNLGGGTGVAGIVPGGGGGGGGPVSATNGSGGGGGGGGGYSEGIVTVSGNVSVTVGAGGAGGTGAAGLDGGAGASGLVVVYWSQ